MSDDVMTIKVINDLMETVLKACLVIHDQLEHDFGSELTTSNGEKFRLTFERIGGDTNGDR